MQLLGDDQRRHRKNRTGAEKFFKRANTFIVAIQLACFLISVSRVSIAADKTFVGGWFFPEDFELDKIIANKTGSPACNASFNEQFFGYQDVNVTVTPHNRGYFFVNLAYRLRYVLAANGAGIAIGGANKLIMDFNRYEFSVQQLIFHKEIITIVEFVILAFNLYQLGVCEMWAEVLRDYLEGCGVESKNSLPYVVPLIEMYFACCFVLIWHFITLAIYCFNAGKKGGTTREGVKAMHAGILEIDHEIQYDEFGTPIIDRDGEPIISGATMTPQELADAHMYGIQHPGDEGAVDGGNWEQGGDPNAVEMQPNGDGAMYGDGHEHPREAERGNDRRGGGNNSATRRRHKSSRSHRNTAPPPPPPAEPEE